MSRPFCHLFTILGNVGRKKIFTHRSIWPIPTFIETGAHDMTNKLTNDQAAALAFEYGKARDSKAFGRLFLRTTLKYAELFAHYSAGMKA